MKPFLLSLSLFCLTTLTQAQNFSAKYFKERLAKVSDSLYAWKYETTNSEYRTFLTELQQAGNNQLYGMAEVDSTGWAKGSYYGEPMVKHYHRHPAFGQYPVVNISMEAAQLYCRWLTDKYNAAPKRVFRKVQFVLPTEGEWMQAAEGGRKQAVFPWGTHNLRNKQGEFLCNFKHISEAAVSADSTGNPQIESSLLAQTLPPKSYDRAVYTSTAKSFQPNALGLYNMSGNVAELTSDGTFTKGGSWNSYGNSVQIRSREAFNGASPQVGFRVFMRVIE